MVRRAITAEVIAKTLRGRKTGGGWMARCPAHDDSDPSLSIHDSDNGRVLVRCHAGCDQTRVIAALRSRGLWEDNGRRQGRFIRRQPRQTADELLDGDDAKRTHGAVRLWQASAPASGTLVETYLQSRGITLPPPPTIRFHPSLPHTPTGLSFPAMIAAVQGPDGKVTAVHRTFLLPSGEGKAQVLCPKMMLGRYAAGAVRLAAAAPKIALAEGLENALSVAQACPELPVWAALSVSNMGNVMLPPIVREVMLCVDGDAAGSQAADAAQKAAQRFLQQGRHVRIAHPPEDKDFNDLVSDVA